MRIFTTIIIAFVALLVAYLATPFVSLYRLANAVESGDLNAIVQSINGARLRHSLNAQVMESYLALTGRKELGRIGTSFTRMTGMSAGDPVVLRILDPKALTDLLKTGRLPAQTNQESSALGPLSMLSHHSFWQVFRNSELGLRYFSITLPIGAPSNMQFRLEFKVSLWQWKLTSLILPRHVRAQLARELADILP
jgi:hypothetical protein